MSIVPYRRPQSSRGTGPSEVSFGAVVTTTLMVLVFVFDVWRFAVLMLAAGVAWFWSTGERTLLQKIVRPLAQGWALASCLLFLLDVSVRLSSPSDGEPVVFAWELTLLRVRDFLSTVKLSWGGLTLILALLMFAAMYAPQWQLVKRFLQARKALSFLPSMMAVLTSVTFLTTVVLPGHLSDVATRAEAKFAQIARTEEELLARSVGLGVLESLVHDPEVQPHLVNDAAAIAPLSPFVRARVVEDMFGASRAQRRTAIPVRTSADDLERAEARVDGLSAELDRGFEELLRKTAEAGGKNATRAAWEALADVFGVQEEFRPIIQSVVDRVGGESVKTRVKPLIDHVVTRLRERYWAPCGCSEASAVTNEVHDAMLNLAEDLVLRMSRVKSPLRSAELEGKADLLVRELSFLDQSPTLGTRYRKVAARLTEMKKANSSRNRFNVAAQRHEMAKEVATRMARTPALRARGR